MKRDKEGRGGEVHLLHHGQVGREEAGPEPLQGRWWSVIKRERGGRGGRERGGGKGERDKRGGGGRVHLLHHGQVGREEAGPEPLQGAGWSVIKREGGGGGRGGRERGGGKVKETRGGGGGKYTFSIMAR